MNQVEDMKILNFLAQTKILWCTFSMTLCLTIIFGIVMHFEGFGIIDEMFIADDIRKHIDAMSPRQRSIHAWLTGTIDVLYPFAYGAFFVGVAIKCFGRYGVLLAIPSILVIPADLTEGLSQIMLLNGQDAFMDLKLIATPIKLVLHIFGLCITILGLLLAFKRRFKTTKL